MPRFWPFANRLPAALPPTCKAWVLNVMSRTGIRLGMSALFLSTNDPAYASDQLAGVRALEELGWEVIDSRLVNQKTHRPIVTTESAPAVLAHPGFTPPHSALTPHSGAINDHLFCNDLDEHQKFDLIVLPGIIDGENLLSRRLRLQTARWLSLLAPGGFFVIPQLQSSTQGVSIQETSAERISAEGTSAENHGLECYLRHLTCFPGDVQVLQEQPRWRDIFSAAGRRKSAHGQKLSTASSPVKTKGLENTSQRNHAHLVLQIPPISHSLSDWENYVEKGLLTEVAACCPGHQQLTHQQLNIAASDRQNRVAAGASFPEKSPFFNERRKAA